MTNTIVEAADSSQNGLINTIWYSNISFELRIRSLSQNRQNDGIGCIHVFPHIFQLIQVRSPFQIDFDLFSKGGVVRI